MSIFTNFDFFLRFLVCGSFHVCRFSQILIFFGFWGPPTTTRHDTETPDPGQPPLPGTKYLVRISPHFDFFCRGSNPAHTPFPVGHDRVLQNARSEGRSSRGISSPGGGLTRIRCFRVASCCRRHCRVPKIKKSANFCTRRAPKTRNPKNQQKSAKNKNVQNDPK